MALRRPTGVDLPAPNGTLRGMSSPRKTNKWLLVILYTLVGIAQFGSFLGGGTYRWLYLTASICLVWAALSLAFPRWTRRKIG